jgi:hypothetical protein
MRKITKRKQATKSPTRQLNEGNVLWQKFRELGQTRCGEFKHLLACNRIPLTTFYSDTYLDKDLTKLPQKRARIYQSFFGDLNWDELVPVSKPSSIVQREEKQEKQNLLAKRLGMNRS